MPLGLNYTTTASDPFYRTNSPRQDTTTDWASTPVISGPGGYLEQNQDAAFTRQLANWGVGLSDVTPYGRFVKDQFRNSQLGFKAELAGNPTLTYQDYIGSLGNAGQWWARYLAQTPRQRGVYSAGPTRTIADI